MTPSTDEVSVRVVRVPATPPHKLVKFNTAYLYGYMRELDTLHDLARGWSMIGYFSPEKNNVLQRSTSECTGYSAWTGRFCETDAFDTSFANNGSMPRQIWSTTKD
ncbi:hypothetical protein DOTSEDRAFT_29375 [Dothistroma septosporum NZE10]|uniref:Uncharacterized protein n=1 Tax=Dothistroma septosporum (strain NZE10 / CBS 128990) TaxID=675120 RepID=N1PC22_DOTSN|nr:hypothetical protein DOTSEDRAFT_29375 [Dothistroma septosporum NZE10]